MKKFLALSVLTLFVVTLASMAFGRTLEEEKEAVRSYLKVLDAKIIKYRSAGDTAKVKTLQAEKTGTLNRWAALKAQMEAQQAAPTPPVAPTATPVAPKAVVAQPAVSAGLFGWGLNTGYTAIYVAGKSVVGLRGDIILSDGLGIGSMLGLANDAINWKLGLGYVTGNDINNRARTAIPVYLDGVINIPADVMGGVKTYLSGGVNYSVYGSSRTSGSYGGQVYYGLKGDIGLGGDSYVEVGYSIVRSGDAHYSMKGIGLNIGTELKL